MAKPVCTCSTVGHTMACPCWIPPTDQIASAVAPLGDEDRERLAEALWFFYAPDDDAPDEQTEEIRAMRAAIDAVARGAHLNYYSVASEREGS